MEKLKVLMLIFVSLASGCERKVRYTTIDKNSDLKIEVKHETMNRGVMILNKKYYLIGSCPLMNKDKPIWLKERYPPLWRPKTKEYTPRISDVQVPYTLYKLENEPFFYVLKNKDTLQFLLKTEP
ncbi:hypothetical protein U1E44_10285 [Arenibacter sp. GZD96]|uniref:hypothetical protein n=1 Tax=Aurantibrevibacter litoralis TaxID=3106030 RepID=UPI002AFFD682|nr:hypothetical protein [Arenibacter sp. GZD-96]MEA1786479.1 hypothetical protein [Arenibacter sp. GZD-96]